jgi:hypothetical protein
MLIFLNLRRRIDEPLSKQISWAWLAELKIGKPPPPT